MEHSRHRARGYLLVLPALLLLTLVFIVPLAILGMNSLHEYQGMGRIGGAWNLANYQDLYADDYFLRLFLRTLLLALSVVALCVVLGYPLAYFLARTRSAWRATVTFACVAPLMISAVIRNLGWFPILAERGLVNEILNALGVTAQPLTLLHNFTGVLIALAHALLPFMILSLKTVIERIPPELEEAARSLGAAPFLAVLRVVLPMSRPGLAAGSVLVFTAALGSFVTPAMAGGGKVQVVATYIGQQFRALLNYPAGATAALLLLVLTWAIIKAARRIDSRTDRSSDD
ncbi:ABC transporter permease [Bordetella sp. N]|uniref:ABC transporter permease n=1 Tax=Bordetella sp. N TaxID=1746199 RepID=UPI00070EB264|nr:ABC transporter permease [Bordetella sp. N]ALM82264.1 hypothetical protein ASB57_04180 [Bordetella sp. N]